MGKNVENKKTRESKIMSDAVQAVCDKINNASVSGSLSRFVVPLSIREIDTLRRAGLCDSSMAFQRALKNAWIQPKFRGAVVDSIFRGFSLGMITVSILSDGTIQFDDGKQRLNFLALTCDNLVGFAGVEFDDSLNRDFIEWSDSQREIFYNYQIPFMVVNGLSDSDRRLQFERLNKGIQLGKLESRRGQILNVVTAPLFVSAVKALFDLRMSIVKPDAKIKPSFESTEEICLQALSYLVAGNCDFTGDSLVKVFKSCDNKDLLSAIKKLSVNVSHFSAFVNKDIDSLRWYVKTKTALNVCLCHDFKGWILDNFVSFPPHAGDIKGASQERWASLCASSSASALHVQGRIDMIKAINDGLTTLNKVGQSSKSLPASLEKINAVSDYKCNSVWVDTWAGTGLVVNDDLVNRVCQAVLKRCSTAVDILPRLEKSGSLSVSYLSNQASHTVGLSALLPDTVKAVAGK